ncbi:MAG TPA: hypothetical protein VGJ84_09360 [Polyangiaceae bacterium]|jgi:hypothetical protein
MKDENEVPTEPSKESLAEMPEVDFSRGIRPNRFAALRGEFKQAVFIERELWEHFGSEEKVLEALRLLVALADRSSHASVNRAD